MELFTPQWDKELTDFIGRAGASSYASTAAKKLEISYRPECEEYVYEEGDWKYLDSYLWNMDGGGEEIVYFKSKPVWVMNYYGYLINTEDSKTIYSFLKQAMRHSGGELPVRGSSLKDDSRELEYKINFTRGEIGNLLGTEQIYQNSKLVYEGYFHGGFVK